MATLKVIAGPGRGRSIEVGREVVIGRSRGDLRLDDDELSRRHIRVAPAGDDVLVEDLGSTNGTYVDGTRINSPTRVGAGSTIEIGRSTILIEAPPRSDAERLRQVGASPPAALAVSPADGLGPVGFPSVVKDPRRELTIRAAVFAVVAVIVVPLLLAQNWGSMKAHPLRLTIKTTILGQQQLTVFIGGLASGTPLGSGSAWAQQDFVLKPGQIPLAPGVPTEYTGKLVANFKGGSISSYYWGFVTGQKNGSTVNNGYAKVISGTGKYKHATGTFRQTGGRPPHSSLATFQFAGNIKY